GQDFNGILTDGAPGLVTLLAPANGATLTTAGTLSWSPVLGATSYDVYVGTTATPAFAGSVGTTSFATGPLITNNVYSWRVVARNGASALGSSATWSFGVQIPPLDVRALRFVPITPCRAVDTRNAPGPLGGPA